MATLTNLQTRILSLDLTQNRQWETWVNGAKLTQSNGSNPRLRQVDLKTTDVLQAVADRVVGIVYECRIIKLGVDPALITPAATWQVSFNGGAGVRQSVKVLPPVRETKLQDFAWLVYLELSR